MLTRVILGGRGMWESESRLPVCCLPALGSNDEALKFSHKACDERDPFLLFSARCWPSGKALRAVSGFNEVLKRMKLI